MEKSRAIQCWRWSSLCSEDPERSRSRFVVIKWRLIITMRSLISDQSNHLQARSTPALSSAKNCYSPSSIRPLQLTAIRPANEGREHFATVWWACEITKFRLWTNSRLVKAMMVMLIEHCSLNSVQYRQFIRVWSSDSDGSSPGLVANWCVVVLITIAEIPLNRVCSNHWWITHTVSHSV